MPPTAGRLCIKLHSARIENKKHHRDEDSKLYVVVEIEEYGRLHSRPSTEPVWNQELTLEVGPQARLLKLCLYEKSTKGDDELIGQGSHCMDGVLCDEGPGLLQSLSVPLISPKDFKAAGEVQISLKFFYGRTPGKFRDVLGKEYINDFILNAGPKEGVKQVNSLSPGASPTARSRPTSPNLKL